MNSDVHLVFLGPVSHRSHTQGDSGRAAPYVLFMFSKLLVFGGKKTNRKSGIACEFFSYLNLENQFEFRRVLCLPQKHARGCTGVVALGSHCWNCHSLLEATKSPLGGQSLSPCLALLMQTFPELTGGCPHPGRSSVMEFKAFISTWSASFSQSDLPDPLSLPNVVQRGNFAFGKAAPCSPLA